MSAKANKARSRRAEFGLHHQLFVTTIGVVVALLVLVGAVSAQPQDPGSVFGAFEAAFNAHDEEATLILFADDGVVRTSPPSPGTTGVFSGTDQIRAWLRGSLAQGNVHEESSSIQVVGNTVTALSSTATDALTQLDASPAESNVEVVVQAGRIQSMTRAGTPQWVAKLQAGLAKVQVAPAQAPSALPRTGDAPTPIAAALGLGAVLLVAGLALRRWRGSES
jgi:LPXTG-motif cell wall-anchored protein